MASAGGRGVAAGGGVQKASSNRSIYEKLYGGARSNKRQLITSTVAKQFSNWAVYSVSLPPFLLFFLSPSTSKNEHEVTLFGNLV